MKDFLKKTKKFILNNQTNLLICLISIIGIIIGSFVIGFIKALLVIIFIDFLIFILPEIVNRKNKNTINKEKKKEEVIKDEKVVDIMTKKDKKKTKKIKNTKQIKNNDIKKDNKKKKKHKLIKIILITFLVCFLLGISACVAFCIYIAASAPKFDPNQLYHKESTILYDSNNTIITKLGNEKRENITYEELPEVLIDAIIATEDSRFFQHNGFDLPRFVKAAIGQVMGKDAGGASTLTMQVVKNHYTSTTSTGFEGIKRKFTDIYMSIFQVEKKYTKEEIIEFYVNSNNLGAGSYGVEQACLTYFDKSCKNINLSEAAIIAGLFQAPSTYNPFIYPEKTEARRKVVLTLMNRHGYITKEEMNAALAIPVTSLIHTNNSKNSYKYQSFIDNVIEEVQAATGNDPYQVPMKIYTTMDRNLQDKIDNIMNGTSYKWENSHVDAGAAIVNITNGSIAALGGGRNKNEARTFNTATQTNKQIGSTAKPLYDYAPGMEYNNFSTYTPFVDEVYTYSDGKEINNWDGGYMGFMTSREALKLSRNIPALKAFQQVNNKNILKFVEGLGLTPEGYSCKSGYKREGKKCINQTDSSDIIDATKPSSVHQAHSIGGYTGESPLTMAVAYGAFGNGGYYTKPYSFTKIIYRENDEVYENKVSKSRAMSAETAYMISDILYGTSSYALGGYSNVNGVNYAAKTGTTNLNDETKKSLNLPASAINDLWVIGYNDTYSIGVWYGYRKLSSQHYTNFGSNEHSRLFQAIAKNVFTKKTNRTKPNGVVEVEVEMETYPAQLPSENTPANMRITELFRAGTEPTEVSPRYKTLDNVTNLTSSINNGQITLSWTAIKTPASMDKNKLTEQFKSHYKNYESAVNQRISWNEKTFGKIQYAVYSKDSSGKLTLITKTSNNSVTFPAKSTTINKFVVKTTYSNYSGCNSSGTETKVNFSGIDSIISSMVKNTSKTINVNSKYEFDDVVVLEDLIEVTDNVSINYEVFNSSDKKVSSLLFTRTPGTYKINYSIRYKTFSDTQVVNVTVVDNNTNTPTDDNSPANNQN